MAPAWDAEREGEVLRLKVCQTKTLMSHNCPARTRGTDTGRLERHSHQADSTVCKNWILFVKTVWDPFFSPVT